MSEDEDDYLSDKFLAESATSTSSSSTKTYTERRKEALRLSAIKNEQNRKKTRHQLEQEALEEGLNTSLFERAKDEGGGSNKALSMMMKMGFKPGQSLGQVEDASPDKSRSPSEGVPTPREDVTDKEDTPGPSAHRINPLPINEWAGKKGIGLGKRAASPSAPERLAKMVKMAEEHEHVDFRDRARMEYAERRAEKQLGPAQRTCANLDEKAGREFNVLWLHPLNPDTFPEGLLDELDDPALITSLRQLRPDHSMEGRLRARMQADALQPVASLEDDDETASPAQGEKLKKTPYSEEDIKEAVQFLRLSAKDRLELVLDYLRRRYAYCFWCGTQYNDEEDMATNCPGPDEDAHD
ncbi:G patch domain-containing protein [Phanerochaete sordida]|uniref:G patch domain-containing protein n=1 Tax=Phanerochaete sordida TaxID=48140 RepID=A0A9P3L864_9APHY|nr:G patch domain-containing protein [Phanerochaete sordida]